MVSWKVLFNYIYRMHGKGCFTDYEGIKWEGEFYNGKYKSNLKYITLF